MTPRTNALNSSSANYNIEIASDDSYFCKNTTFTDGLHCFVFNIHQFPLHETIKLTLKYFILWKHQVMLIIKGYDISIMS